MEATVDIAFSDLIRFSRCQAAQSVTSSDVRFGTILKAARIRGEIERDVCFSEIIYVLFGSGKPACYLTASIAEQLRLVAGEITNASEYTVSREIQDIALSMANIVSIKETTDPTLVGKVFGMRYGLLGDSRTSYNEIGQRVGMSKKSVSRVMEKMVAARTKYSIFAPSCDRLVKAIEARLPCSHSRLEAELRGVLGEGISLDSAIRFIREFLAHPFPIAYFSASEKSGGRVVSLDAHIPLLRRVHVIASQMVSHVGAGQIDWIAGRSASHNNDILPPSSLVDILSSSSCFEWLDESNGWFWYGKDDPKNRLVQSIRKIDYVSRSAVDPEDVIYAMSRGRTEMIELANAISLSTAAVKNALYFIRGGGGLATRYAAPAEDAGSPLSESEYIVFDMARQSGGVLSYAELSDLCVDSNLINLHTLNKTLSHSPIFRRVSEGIYALVGWPLDPAGLARANLRSAEAKVRRGRRKKHVAP